MLQISAAYYNANSKIRCLNILFLKWYGIVLWRYSLETEFNRANPPKKGTIHAQAEGRLKKNY